MREPRRSPRLRTAPRFAGIAVGITLALSAGANLTHAQVTPRLLTLEESGRDRRVDPLLARMAWRAAVEPVEASSLEAFVDGRPAFANFAPDKVHAASPVALMIEGTPDRAELESRGIVVGTVAGDVVTATMPISLLPELLTVPGVTYVAASAVVEPALDTSAKEIDADEAWGGTPPSYPAGSLTGNGVVVGIVDTGVDPRPSDFKTATGQTRFKAIWDQQWTGGPPANFAYGSEYTESEINAGQITSYHDYDGHGTHIAGVAGGNGQSTGNGKPGYRYVGIAPRSTLIGVKAYMLESQVIDAVNYVFQKAASLNMPAVVNLSISVQLGPRDGSHAFDRGLSALTGPGKIITAAAGNKATDNHHVRVNLGSGANVDATFDIPVYTPSISQSEAINFEGWHDPSASFDVKLTSPTGISTPTIAPGTDSGFLVTNDGTLYVRNAMTTSTSGAKQILINVSYGTAGTARPRSGTWRINLKRRTGTTTGLAHMWLVSYLLGSTTPPAFTGSLIDTACTITSPASADSVISTGAYTTKVRWSNLNGSTSLYPYSPPLYKLAAFSSRGPRRDGVQRPDLTAPGYGVMATASTDASVSATYKDPDGVHFMNKGTSVANAHTTGAVALLLEGNRFTTPGLARATLRGRARTDTYTGLVPSGNWGYGKLDVTSGGTTGVNDGIALGLSFRNVFPNPSRDYASFEFDVSSIALSQGASTPVEVRIFDVRGREITRIAGASTPGTQRIAWNGRDADGNEAAAGVYFARLIVGATELQKKFVRVAE